MFSLGGVFSHFVLSLAEYDNMKLLLVVLLLGVSVFSVVSATKPVYRPLMATFDIPAGPDHPVIKVLYSSKVEGCHGHPQIYISRFGENIAFAISMGLEHTGQLILAGGHDLYDTTKDCKIRRGDKVIPCLQTRSYVDPDNHRQINIMIVYLEESTTDVFEAWKKVASHTILRMTEMECVIPNDAPDDPDPSIDLQIITSALSHFGG